MASRKIPPTNIPILDEHGQFTLPWRLWLQNNLGEDGATGPEGPQGPTGPQGPAGNTSGTSFVSLGLLDATQAIDPLALTQLAGADFTQQPDPQGLASLAYNDLFLIAGSNITLNGSSSAAIPGQGPITIASTASGGSVSVTATSPVVVTPSPGTGTFVISLNTVTVAKGGTGDTTLTNHGVLIGQGTSAVAVSAAGTSGQVLTSNGASADPTYQTGPALQLISEIVTSGSQASVTFSSIATTWRDLTVRVRGRSQVSFVVDSIVIQFNGDAGANYDYMLWQAFGTTVSGASSFAQTSIQVGQLAGATAPANYAGAAEFHVFDYRGTTFDKQVIAHSGVASGTSGNGTARLSNEGNWRSTAAINAIKVFLGTGPFVDGSIVSLYGHF